MTISEKCALVFYISSSATSPELIQESTETFTLRPVSIFPNSDSFLNWGQHRSSKWKNKNADNEATFP